MQQADVYRTKDSLHFSAVGQAGALGFALDFCRTTSLQANAETIEALLMETLDASLTDLEPPADLNNIGRPLLALARVRSWAELEETSVNCSVERDAQSIRFSPIVDRGFSPSLDSEIPADASAEDIRDALMRALDLAR